MKLILTGNNDMNREVFDVEISNEGFDNLNFVQIKFFDYYFDVPLDELISAVEALKKYRGIKDNKEKTRYIARNCPFHTAEPDPKCHACDVKKEKVEPDPDLEHYEEKGI